MKRGNLLWALLIVGLAAGFFIGRWKGRSESVDVFINNPELVKQIAELAVLQVDGNARITESNASVSKSFWTDLSDFLGERTVSVEIPYTAKYGVDLAKSDLKLKKKKGKEVLVQLEKPDLQSFEMRIDRLQQQTKNGVFSFQKDDKLKIPMQKLYSETKKKLSHNTENIKLAKENIEKVLNKYFQELGLESEYQWQEK